MRKIEKIGIVGGGTMGVGIAVLTSQFELPTVVKEVDEELAQKTLRTIHEKLDRAGGKLHCGSPEIAKRFVSVTSSYADLSNADLIIEAVPENLELKKEVFRQLEANAKPETILVSNTSSLPVSEMAFETKRPDKVMGMHFFNPPSSMHLIELIRGAQASNETFKTVKHLAEYTLGKKTIEAKEMPGFVVNRILMPYCNEAGLLLRETNLSAEVIDAEAKNFGWPMGPFELLDRLGIDVGLEVAKILHKAYGKRMEPAEILDVLVKMGRLGKKTGAGFYSDSDGTYAFQSILEKNFALWEGLSVREGFERMTVSMVLEALRCLEDGVATADDIDKGCMWGIFFPHKLGGPLHYAQDYLGLDNLLEISKRLEKKYETRFHPPDILVNLVETNKKIFEENKEDW